MLQHSVDRARSSGYRDPWFRRVVAHMPPTVLVSAGIVMFALYIFMDVVGSLSYDGYSYKDQTISELSAVGAPTRAFWLVMSVFYALLAFAFAFGVLALREVRRSVQVVGWLLLASAVGGLLWWAGPMHQREVLAAGGGTWRDTLHLIAGGISSVLFFAMIAAGAFAFGPVFRWYSLATIAVMVVFGTLMNLDIADVSDNEPTPWLGIWERIAVEGAMLWEAVFAATLIRTRLPSTVRERGEPG